LPTVCEHRFVSASRWLDWSRQLQAIAQTGLSYDAHPYHADRYEAIRRIAAEIAAHSSETSVETVEALFMVEAGHATPKLDVRGAVFQAGALLLVRERASGLWTLPGGWADCGESAAESVAREVREESGYAVRASKLISLHDRERRGYPPHRWYTYKATFLCELIGVTSGEPDHEVLEVGFFAESELPALDLNRTAGELVALCFRHARDWTMPTDFD
jgi:ADP-ribose pyrophosphatase YjhB (NUDIX family)